MARMLLSVLGIFLCAGALAQNVALKGVVKDNTGEKLTGVSIIVENTSTGTTTNSDGEYSIEAPKGATLVFFFLGFETQRVEVGNRTVVDVVMSQTAVGMDEVVVVGYGTQSRRTITSAVTKIDGDLVKGTPVNTLGEALKGKIAGARVYSSNNTPGADPVIRIRGGSSIDGNNDPLILVDGVERAFSGINPNDIESMEVLKDAASTAVYGSRGSNGVVLITTKSGKRNTGPRVTFDANVGFQQAERRFDLLGAEDYIRIVRTSIAEGTSPMNNFTSGFSASSINDANSVYSTRWLEEGEAVPAGYKKMRDPLDNTKWLIFQDNDWQDVLFRDNWWQNYYVGIDGGTEKTSYAASVGYTKDDGVALGTGYDRLNARISLNSNVTKRLRVRATADYSDARSEEFDNQMNAISRALSAAPTMKRYMADGVTPAYGYNATSLNPEYYAYIYDFDNRNKRLSIVGGLDWEIIDGLKATVDASTYNHVTRKSSFRKRGYFSNLTPTTESFNELTRTKLDAYVNYSRTFAEKHSLSAMAGYSYSRDKTNAFAASAEGGGSDLTPTLTAQPDRTSSTSSFSEIVMLSYFGRINYDYKKKYMLTATFRADGSSKFLKGNQWGYFPAMSAGWMISEENFMESTRRVVDDLKLRVSYGQTGNNYISVNDARGKYNVNFYNGNPGLHPAVMPNQDLQWEVTTQLDAGFDLSMFNNRLMVTADYFNRLTDNLIYSKDMPNTTGFSSVKTNIGKVRFYGFDLEISSRNIVKKNFSWESKFTWSYVKNKVVKLPDNGLPQNRVDGIRVGNTNEYFGGIAEGEPLYQVVAFKMKHIIRTPEQLAAAIYDSYSKGYNPDDGTTVKGRKNMGDYEWVNRPGTTKAVVNGEEVEQINSEDKFVIGYSVPHSTGGFSNTFRYKGLSLNVYLDWAIGHIIRTPEQLAAAIYDSYSKGYNPDDGTTVKGRKNMGDYEWVNRPGTTKAVVNGEEVEQINSEDKFVIGYSVPHSTGGFSNTFRYKGLSLNVYLDWAIGHTIRHAQMARQFINTFTGNTALNAGVLDTWSPQNPDAKYARFYSGGESVSANFKNDSDVFAFKGDYLCIRELSLAWDLPKKFVSKLGMQGASITLAGNNLHYFTAVPGVSPEVGTMSTNAAGYNNYPPIRRISLGIKVIF